MSQHEEGGLGVAAHGGDKRPARREACRAQATAHFPQGPLATTLAQTPALPIKSPGSHWLSPMIVVILLEDALLFSSARRDSLRTAIPGLIRHALQQLLHTHHSDKNLHPTTPPATNGRPRRYRRLISPSEPACNWPLLSSPRCDNACNEQDSLKSWDTVSSHTNTNTIVISSITHNSHPRLHVSMIPAATITTIAPRSIPPE